MAKPIDPAWSPRLGKSLDGFRGSAVVVAVSGGGDSVGLLRAMVAIGGEFGFKLSVANLNHGTRGEEAEADARFVADLAAGLGLPIDRGDWAPVRAGHFEEDARRARYEWLAEVAKRRGARAVAVGHTLDDQVETILHRIVRGTGVDGLGGMARVRGLAPGVALVRPLLEVRRQEVRDYLEAIGQGFREDASNADTSRTRSRIRHDLLPKLVVEYNPQFAESLVRLGQMASFVSRSMAARSRDLAREIVLESGPTSIRFDRERLARLEPFLQAEVIRLAWKEAAWPESSMDFRRWRRLASLAKGEGRRLSVGIGVEATTTRDRLVLERRPTRLTRAPRPIEIPGRVAWDGFDLITTIDPDEARDESVDLDRISLPLMVREPGAGDRFEPLGMDGRGKALNDFFRGRKVVRGDRTSVPLVCDQLGIVWVAGHRIAHRARLTEETRRTLGLRLDPRDRDAG